MCSPFWMSWVKCVKMVEGTRPRFLAISCRLRPCWYSSRVISAEDFFGSQSGATMGSAVGREGMNPVWAMNASMAWTKTGP